MNVAVSEASCSDLPAQVEDAERFLDAHRGEVARLADQPGVSHLVLDFPIDLRIDDENVFFQCDQFPASLVRIAGSLGIALELSIYPAGEQ